MPEPATLLVFLAAALVLIAIPGPNLVYITTRSAAEGRRSGLASAAGVETGTLVHVGLAAAGLSALLASSAVAFSAVKYLGAAYLVVLGGILAVVGLAIDAAYAVAAASVGRRLRARHAAGGRAGDGRAGRLATGAIYLTLGVVAALTGERRAPAGP
jgi:threonine/homoserine/homoserine lactone efflux protein